MKTKKLKSYKYKGFDIVIFKKNIGYDDYASTPWLVWAKIYKSDKLIVDSRKDDWFGESTLEMRELVNEAIDDGGIK